MTDSEKINTLYDPITGERLMTVEGARVFLNYENQDSIRRLACEDKIPSRKTADKILLFRKHDLEIYQKENRWAAAKAKLPRNAPVDEKFTTRLYAKIMVDFGTGYETQWETDDSFSMEKSTEIRARLNSEYSKDLNFTINVKTPDGSSWTIIYRKPTWLENWWKKVTGEKGE